MSEFSDSFHVRIATRRAAAARMRSANLRGVVYPPANGWCTVVPFDEGRSAEEMAQVFAAPVLHYFFAEDHGWGFSFVRGGETVSRYRANWDGTTPTLETAALQVDALRDLLRPGIDTQALDASLRAGAEPAAASAFAQALGLPQFEWTSPHYAQTDFKAGELPRTVLVVGAPDPEPELPMPPVQGLVLPRADLSAAETLQLLLPRLRQWDSTAYPDLLCSTGDLQGRSSGAGPMISGGGRAMPHGGWAVRCVSSVHGVSTWITVPASGNIAARSWALQPFMAGPPLPAEWLDSTRVAAIAEALFERRQAAGHPPLFDRILRLEPWRPDDRFAWQVRFFCAGERKRWDLTLVLDAVSGQLVHEEERSA